MKPQNVKLISLKILEINTISNLVVKSIDKTQIVTFPINPSLLCGRLRLPLLPKVFFLHHINQHFNSHFVVRFTKSQSQTSAVRQKHSELVNLLGTVIVDVYTRRRPLVRPVVVDAAFNRPFVEKPLYVFFRIHLHIWNWRVETINDIHNTIQIESLSRLIESN